MKKFETYLILLKPSQLHYLQSISFCIHIIWQTGKNIFKISQGTKISTTKFDPSKIKPVLNLIRLRYIYFKEKKRYNFIQNTNEAW